MQCFQFWKYAVMDQSVTFRTRVYRIWKTTIGNGILFFRADNYTDVIENLSEALTHM